MNIEQYRALKALEAQGSQVDQSKVDAQVQTPEVTNQTIEQPVVETNIQEEIEIEGVGKVKLSELKNGYLRQSDYTKKTQELASSKRELEDAVKVYDYLKAHPEIANEMVKKSEGNVGNTLTEEGRRIMDLEQKIFDLSLQLEIDRLSTKYPDFEVKDVLTLAKEKNLTNLEDAYRLSVSNKASTTTVDMDALRAQIRAEELQKLQQETLDTRSLIGVKSTKDGQSNDIQISQAELKVAQRMKISPEEYIKWRDAGKL